MNQPRARDLEGHRYVHLRGRVREQAQRYDGSRGAYTIALGVLVFLLILAVSFYQTTRASTAKHVLQAGIVTITDIDKLLAEEGPALHQAAQNTNAKQLAVPGYPLPVTLSPAEIKQLNDAQLRSLILQRSADQVYSHGLGAFDRTGHQSLDSLSSQGLLESVAGQMTKAGHSRAQIAMWVLLALVALCVLTILYRNDGYRRLRALGIGAAAGAFPGMVIFFAGRFWAGRMGGGDAFSKGVRQIATSLLDLPGRDFTIVFILGLVLVAMSIVFSLVARRLPQFDAEQAAGHEPIPLPTYDEDSYDEEEDEEPQPRRQHQ